MEKCSVCGSGLDEKGYHLENPDCNAGPLRPSIYGLAQVEIEEVTEKKKKKRQEEW